MTRPSPTAPLRPVGTFFTAAIFWALIAAVIFGLVAGLVLGDTRDDGSLVFSWMWSLGGFALSGIMFLPIVMGFEALRRVGHNQEILGAKLDIIHDERTK
ncbi:hypothetical protein [Demequina oxidasica]|uniref:hypothetical protein n=1 Tax=Demequina oxidasica TaxID=676199 RepID=UPI000782A3F0|nr:hypothetical protein [Demequina oxidasica]